MRNESEDPLERIRAAVSALPYCHPRITPISFESLNTYSSQDEEGDQDARASVDELVDRLYAEARKSKETVDD